MGSKKQSERLTVQHVTDGGVKSIFNELAKKFDMDVGDVSKNVYYILKKRYPKLTFRYRKDLKKSEINQSLHELDPELGNLLYIDNARIIPDGGLIEVLDDNGNWRVVLVSEAKFQGRDIDNIKNGIKVGKKKDQDLMVAGNAIERSHKNIAEIRNYLLSESYFPYALFLSGSNFLTQDLEILRPDKAIFQLKFNAGSVNRLDRLTAAMYGMEINVNHCVNKFIAHNDKFVMLQSVSIYTTGDGTEWTALGMAEKMLDISSTSIKMIFSDLYNQIMK